MILLQHALRLRAIGDIRDSLPYHLAQEKDCAISIARVLQSAIDNRPLAFHHGLVLQRNDALDLAVEPPIVRLPLSLLRPIHITPVITPLLRFFGIDRQTHFLAVRIVDGNNPNRLLERYWMFVGIFGPALSGLSIYGRQNRASSSQCHTIRF